MTNSVMVINGQCVPVQTRYSERHGLVTRVYGDGVGSAPTDIIFARENGHVGPVHLEPHAGNQEYNEYLWYYGQQTIGKA